MTSIMDGVKIGFGMFVVLPILILSAIILFFWLGFNGAAIIVFSILIYLAATKYKGKDIAVKKKK